VSASLVAVGRMDLAAPGVVVAAEMLAAEQAGGFDSAAAAGQGKLQIR